MPLRKLSKITTTIVNTLQRRQRFTEVCPWSHSYRMAEAPSYCFSRYFINTYPCLPGFTVSGGHAQSHKECGQESPERDGCLGPNLGVQEGNVQSIESMYPTPPSCGQIPMAGGTPGTPGVGGPVGAGDTVEGVGGAGAVRSAGRVGRRERWHQEARSLRTGKKVGSRS